MEPKTHAGTSLLAVDVAGARLTGKLEMPPWLDVVQEVTDDERYQTWDIAKKPIVKA